MTLGDTDILARLGVAALIGCILGLNRELHAKPAGMRTHGLICLGAALITVASTQMAFDGTRVDSDSVLRAIQGILAGIGFMGGGAILRDVPQRSIHGLTTAATLWVAACLGIACGAGLWLTAFGTLGIALAVLILGNPVERAFRRWFGRTEDEPGPPG